MLIIRPFAVVEDRVRRRKVLQVWVQPRVDVLLENWADAAVLASRCDFLRWLIGDGCKREQVRCAGARRPRPQAHNEHLLCWPWPEYEHNIFDLLALAQLAVLRTMLVDVFDVGRTRGGQA